MLLGVMDIIILLGMFNLIIGFLMYDESINKKPIFEMIVDYLRQIKFENDSIITRG